MALLVEGGVHPVVSSSKKLNISVLYVKLTDSALESLQDIARKKGSDLDSPTIQLRNSGGVIVVPRTGHEKQDRFSFSILNQQDDSSYQCLKSTDHGLQSLGTMRETIRVQANEDSYGRTIQRQHEAKRENEKKTTKLLEGKDKKKLGLPRSSQLLLKTNSVKPVVPSTTSRHYPSAFSSAEPPYSGPGRGGGAGLGGGPGLPQNTARPQPVAHQHQQEKHSVNRNEIKKCHPSNKATPNPEIMKRPLRERLIHLLAVKPYKKIELVPRLNRDGLRTLDKKNVMTVLGEVAQYKNNIYELKRTVWNDVMEDWPFYTESDRAALRWRKPQNLTPPGSDNGSTSSGHSPSSTNPPSPPQITNPLKRQSYYEQGSETSSKKKRLSHYKRPQTASSDQVSSGFSRSPCSLSGSSPMLSGSVSSPGLNLDTSTRNMERLELNESATFEDASAPDWGQFHDNSSEYQQQASVAVNRPPSRSGSPPPHSSSLHQPQQLPPQSNYRSSPAPQPSSQLRRSPAVNDGGFRGSGVRATTGNSPAAARTSSPAATRPWNSDNSDGVDSVNGASPPLNFHFHIHNSNTDFLREYTPIASAEQRAHYKQEFNTYYAQYRQYHDVLRRVQNKFSELQNQRRQAVRGTPEFTRIKMEIVAEYERNIADVSMQEARQNFQYLHEKLAHLKRLVHDYDTTQRS